jgi:hypothetical protein
MSDSVAIPNDIRPDLKGEHYLTLLGRIHSTLKPRTYLEIGTRDGASLKLSKAKSIAIDPSFVLSGDVVGEKSLCALYKTTSDQFFQQTDPKVVVGGPLDFVFLDGMHLAEFLLRDFINIERHTRGNSIIAIHDCVPVETGIARRVEQAPADKRGKNHPTWWTGDVWKVIAMLQERRPTLKILAVDAVPTGLVLITNCDPKSTILLDQYSDIVEEFRTDMDDSYLVKFVRSINILSTSSLVGFEEISRYFWI